MAFFSYRPTSLIYDYHSNYILKWHTLKLSVPHLNAELLRNRTNAINPANNLGSEAVCPYAKLYRTSTFHHVCYPLIENSSTWYSSNNGRACRSWSLNILRVISNPNGIKDAGAHFNIPWSRIAIINHLMPSYTNMCLFTIPKLDHSINGLSRGLRYR